MARRVPIPASLPRSRLGTGARAADARTALTIALALRAAVVLAGAAVVARAAWPAVRTPVLSALGVHVMPDPRWVYTGVERAPLSIDLDEDFRPRVPIVRIAADGAHDREPRD